MVLNGIRLVPLMLRIHLVHRHFLDYNLSVFRVGRKLVFHVSRCFFLAYRVLLRLVFGYTDSFALNHKHLIVALILSEDLSMLHSIHLAVSMLLVATARARLTASPLPVLSISA